MSRVKIAAGVLVVVAVCAAGALAFKNGLIPYGNAAAGQAASATGQSQDSTAPGDSQSPATHPNDDPFADAAPLNGPEPAADTASAHDEHHHHHAHHENGAADSDWQNADENGIHKVSGSKPADSSNGPDMQLPGEDSFKDLPAPDSDKK
jgi:hypothetical protein